MLFKSDTNLAEHQKRRDEAFLATSRSLSCALGLVLWESRVVAGGFAAAAAGDESTF